MENTSAKYTFSPWLRRGIINNITGSDNVERALVKIPVDVSLEDGSSNLIAKDNAEQEIHLYGPGDIIGIQPMAIVRTEPRDGTMEFENNYMPFIEFFEEDFPWRYSPIAFVGDRLDPWLTLIALKEEEIDKSEGGINWEARPLPSVILSMTACQNLPNNKEQWAWAHTHISYQNNDAEGDTNPDLNKVDAYNLFQKTTLDSNPDAAYSRILCPRKLEPETRYFMFLIPTFESGRLAGLGLTTKGCLATSKAWGEKSVEKKENRVFPFYYHWRFKTGSKGDFEYLVTLLKAKPAKDIHEQLGKRLMDVSKPYPDSKFEGINTDLALEGALKPPGMAPTNWAPTTGSGDFVKNLSERINNSILNRLKGQSNNNSNESNYLPPPFYAQWQAWVNSVDVPADANSINWIQELNLDPRHRVTAALGAQAIQKSQDEYLQDAWNQVSGIVSVNQKLQESEFAIAASEQFFAKHFKPLSEDRMLMITGPVHNRVLMGATTIARSLYDSPVSTVLSSPSFRRIARPIGPVIKRKVHSGALQGRLFDQVNKHEIELFSLNKDLRKAFTFQKVAEEKLAESLSAFVNKPGGIPSGASVNQQLQFIDTQIKQGKFVQVLSSAKGRYYFLQRSNFTKSFAEEAIQYFNSTLPLIQVGKKRILSTKQNDSLQFLTAVKDVFALFEKQPLPVKAKGAIKLTDAQKSLMTKLSPKYVLGRKWEKLIPLTEEVGPLMAYPEFHRPMYKPLAEISGDFMLPNMQFVSQNTITILESNDRFIEAYMAGLNHEMSRELLWQEYPTDMRGSYFRQFWDISDYIPFEDLENKYWNNDLKKEKDQLKKTLEGELLKEPKEYLKEKYGTDVVADIVERRVGEWKNWKINQLFKDALKDIKPIHQWLKNTKLGTHTQRPSMCIGDSRLVLLIRGDLLRRYPNTVIYAQKAEKVDWEIGDKNFSTVPEGYKNEDGIIKYPDDNTLDPSTIKFPAFKGFVAPDVYLLGFDMCVREALKEPGWFFIIKERPGEPRFGLDVLDPPQNSCPANFNGWNAFSWEHSSQDFSKVPYISLSYKVSENTNPDEKGIQWGLDAAQMAYILYQVPTLVAYHATALLGNTIK